MRDSRRTARIPGGFTGLWLGGCPLGVWVMVALAAGASAALLAWPGPSGPGRDMWLFARMHLRMYEPIVERWNQSRPLQVRPVLMSLPAIERRMLGGFLAEVRTADLLEVERRVASRAFAGPLEAVGFLDLTDRLRDAGLTEAINAPSFSPWSKGGRIFGLPHDVHPVMLAYRADLVEAAGIDMGRVETWDDLARELAPLMADDDGDGAPDRYLLAFWPAPSHADAMEALLLQGGGGFFDERDRLVIASEANARALAAMVQWTTGSSRIAADVPEFSAAGNRLKLDGYAVCFVMPDWLCNIYRHELPQLSGKLKLMPLPAWERGGRRTSVWGGTMLGVARTAPDPDRLWEFATHLYFSEELARRLYREGDIITPIVEHWDDPMFDEPDPYFGGQAKGRMYIDLARDVPRRSASPFNSMALQRVQDALIGLRDWAERTGTLDREALAREAMTRLRAVEEGVRAQMERSTFAREGP